MGKHNESEPEFIARYRKCDMKPQCLWEHLQAVSEMTGQFAGKVGLETVGSLLGLEHDLGKATVEFKEYLKHNNGLINELSFNLKGGKLDHATAGAQALYEALLQPDGTTTLAADILSMTVASHHGFMDALTPDGHDTLTRRLEKNESETRKTQALSSLPLNIKKRLQELLANDINQELLVFLQRTIDTSYGVNEAHFNMGLIVRFLLSCLIDADRINAADSETPDNQGLRQYGKYAEWDRLIKYFEGYLATFKITNDIDTLRRDISEKCLAMSEEERGFFRLTVPTGGGKTLASLRFALHHAKKHRMQRIIYIIPYTSIIDQNAKSIREALGVDPKDTKIVLEHHSNLLLDKIDDEDEKSKENYQEYKLLAENWDSPIILTTMVQFMETLYGAGTNSCRRMHQLANSVIIFDEIQSLPINLIHLFNLAVKFLAKGCNASIMLCTATQPVLHEIKPPARSLPFDDEREIAVTEAQRRKTLDRVEVLDVTRPQGWNNHQIAELASKENGGEKSTLIIVNTKRDARNIFEHLKTMTKTPVYHLSTSMCPAHRIVKLEHVTKLLHPNNGQPFILVSTQLIEAGVDVDFDVVIRSLAGIDSIAQAAGRCNRHGSKPYRGRVLIVNSNEENLSKLPSIVTAQKEAARVLGDFHRDKAGFFQGSLLSDPALESYFRYYFHTYREQMDYPIKSQSPVGRGDSMVDLLSMNQKSIYAYMTRTGSPKLNRFLNQSFQTAARSFEVIDNAGQGVIVPHGEGAEIINDLCEVFEPNKHFEILRQAQRYSVNCFSHELEQLSQAGALREVQEGSGILYVDITHYHPELGLTREKSNKMPILSDY